MTIYNHNFANNTEIASYSSLVLDGHQTSDFEHYEQNAETWWSRLAGQMARRQASAQLWNIHLDKGVGKSSAKTKTCGKTKNPGGKT
ncbi:hypothetical protein LIPSTDRAFT_67713 [Lipomyces starkeyi NRRL Y-11557]|uniref:Uncharacterized protein n=1 Tax=Lipomyces starkeyi NRRL Y-11557 TaxID=675824 RepID=A0A1E3QGB6_LIPST|nr:hypothetical protein LIPSTDRAFT_67713 [Lipomyces starkeyi NRRL Y-11557]